MTVSLVQWRAVIGIFNCRCLVISKSSISCLTKNFVSIFESLFLCLIILKVPFFFINLLVYFCSSTAPRKLYQEVGLESLQLRRWYRKLCLFYKIFKNKSPAYLFNLIPARNTHYSLRTSDNIPCFNTKHSFFKNSFFPSTIIEWNKLDLTLRKCDSFNVFKKEILKFIRPSSNSF